MGKPETRPTLCKGARQLPKGSPPNEPAERKAKPSGNEFILVLWLPSSPFALLFMAVEMVGSVRKGDRATDIADK